MKHETADDLAKARECLDEVKQIARIGLLKVAIRCAYYAAFHAAEAMIVEQTGKIAKSRSGVRSEFTRLTKAHPAFDSGLSAFSGHAYKYKEMFDYGIGTSLTISVEDTNMVIKPSERCVNITTAVLEHNRSGNPSKKRPETFPAGTLPV